MVSRRAHAGVGHYMHIEVKLLVSGTLAERTLCSKGYAAAQRIRESCHQQLLAAVGSACTSQTFAKA